MAVTVWVQGMTPQAATQAQQHSLCQMLSQE